MFLHFLSVLELCKCSRNTACFWTLTFKARLDKTLVTSPKIFSCKASWDPLIRSIVEEAWYYLSTGRGTVCYLSDKTTDTFYSNPRFWIFCRYCSLNSCRNFTALLPKRAEPKDQAACYGQLPCSGTQSESYVRNLHTGDSHIDVLLKVLDIQCKHLPVIDVIEAHEKQHRCHETTTSCTTS